MGHLGRAIAALWRGVRDRAAIAAGRGEDERDTRNVSGLADAVAIDGELSVERLVSSFLKKRSKKLFRMGVRVSGANEQTDKSFLVLFFKKELLGLS
jgi:hypothetical protein